MISILAQPRNFSQQSNVAFGSLTVDENSSTPYTDATQVSLGLALDVVVVRVVDLVVVVLNFDLIYLL